PRPGRSIPIDSTTARKVPWRAGFLPCTPAAMQPPTLARGWPGATGRYQPRASAKRCSSPMHRPASTAMRPLSGSNASRRSKAERSWLIDPASKLAATYETPPPRAMRGASAGNAASREAASTLGIELSREGSALDLLRRPELDYAKLAALDAFAP